MPDHLHVIGTLTNRLTVGQVVGRLKAKTRSVLFNAGLRWQGNYFEHRMRSDDHIEDVLRYLNMNPYRAQLLANGERYAHFWLGEAEASWFRPGLEFIEEKPFPEWLA